MKASDFKNLIRESVREELSAQLPVILKEFFVANNPPKTSPTKPPTPSQPSNTKVYMDGGLPSKPAAKKIYTNNSVLNDILNETVVKIPTETGIRSQSVTDSENASIDPKLSDIFNRNYRDVLKAVDEKVKSSRG